MGAHGMASLFHPADTRQWLRFPLSFLLLLQGCQDVSALEQGIRATAGTKQKRDNGPMRNRDEADPELRTGRGVLQVLLLTDTEMK